MVQDLQFVWSTYRKSDLLFQIMVIFSEPNARAKANGWNFDQPEDYYGLLLLEVPEDCIAAPRWWPLTSQLNHCRYLFVMMDNLPEYMRDTHKVKHIYDDGKLPRTIEFVQEVLRSVLHSVYVHNHQSFAKVDHAFLPTSTTIQAARELLSKAEEARGKQLRRREGVERVCLRIDIWAWFQSGTMPPAALIDLSSAIAQQMFYQDCTAAQFGIRDTDYDIACSWSIDYKEVLVKWRGEVPLKYIDVLDEGDEHNSLGTVEDILNDVREDLQDFQNVGTCCAMISSPGCIPVQDFQNTGTCWNLLCHDLAVQTTLQATAGTAAAAAAAETLFTAPWIMPRPRAHPETPHQLSEVNKDQPTVLRAMCQPTPFAEPASEVTHPAPTREAACTVAPPAPTANHSNVAPSQEVNKKRKLALYSDIAMPSRIEGADLDISEGTIESKQGEVLNSAVGNVIQLRSELAAVPAIAKAQAREEFILITPKAAVTQCAAPGNCTLNAKDVGTLAKLVRIHKDKQNEAFRQKMSPTLFALFEKIVASEATYFDELAQLTRDRENSVKGEDVYHDSSMSSNMTGFDKNRQMARREFKEELALTPSFEAVGIRKLELLREHGQRLVAMDALLLVPELPASWASKRALKLMEDDSKVANPASISSSGAKPSSVVLQHMSYKELLVSGNFIYLPPHSQGRKPSSGCKEIILSDAEAAEGYDWANWFMTLGGFKALIMRLLYWLESGDLGVKGVICVVWGLGMGGVWGGVGRGEVRAGRGAPAVRQTLLCRTLLWQTLLCQTLLWRT